MTIFKRCSQCHRLYEGRHCSECAKKRAAKRYQDTEKMYSTYKWQRCRENVIIKYQGMDIWQLAIGNVVICNHPVIHHIVERDEAPELRYRLDNLIPVTSDSHAEIHSYYRTDKQYALKRIADGIRKFKEEYGND